jgi:hypothetical protein
MKILVKLNIGKLFSGAAGLTPRSFTVLRVIEGLNMMGLFRKVLKFQNCACVSDENSLKKLNASTKSYLITCKQDVKLPK